jgi:hypothetical protein
MGELLGTLQNYAAVPQSHLSVEAYSGKGYQRSNQLNSFNTLTLAFSFWGAILFYFILFFALSKEQSIKFI